MEWCGINIFVVVISFICWIELEGKLLKENFYISTIIHPSMDIQDKVNKYF